MSKVIIVTGAANGIGVRLCGELAGAGHTVYIASRDYQILADLEMRSPNSQLKLSGINLHAVDLNVSSQSSSQLAVDTIVAEAGRIDVVVHNSTQVVYGPTEAFTPEQIAEIYETNILCAQRLNRAVLPQMRKQGCGLLVWVSSSSARGASPPFSGVYASSKAALDALAIGYAGELTRWGIETTIVVTPALGPSHYLRSDRPRDLVRAEEYADGPTVDLSDRARRGLSAISPNDFDLGIVACAIGTVIQLPFGRRPFRIHFDPDDDGAALLDKIADRVRTDLLRRVGIEDILKPAIIG